MPDVKSLLPLQEVDMELFRVRRERQRKPAELADLKAAVAEGEERVAGAEGRIKEIKVEAGRHELEMKGTEERIKKYEQDALKVKKNSEFLAIQKAIGGVRADQSLITERWLEVEARLEHAARTRDEAQADLETARGRLGKEEAKIEREIEDLDVRIAELEAKRRGLLEGLDPELLGVYERVIRSGAREGQGLAQLIPQAEGRPRKSKKVDEKPEDNLGGYAWHCSGCHTQVTLQVVNLLMMSRDLRTCQSCSRILYYDPTA